MPRNDERSIQNFMLLPPSHNIRSYYIQYTHILGVIRTCCIMARREYHLNNAPLPRTELDQRGLGQDPAAFSVSTADGRDGAAAAPG